MYPMLNPQTNPHPYPINIENFQFKASPSSSNFVRCGSKFCSLLHSFDKGSPHKPKFPMLNTSKNIRFTNSAGIFPSSLFDERSNDSSADKFPKNDGIAPVKLL
ncbi:hypothetical protein QQP08_020334 [Theobroma cacao]|nr:hypothetical protein QQP08_020334 [Theobroma cacao]